MAFRGSSDKRFAENNGNFLQLVQLLGKYDPIMKEHLRRAVKREISDHYCSKTIQEELISLLAKQIIESIVSGLKAAKYFSMILDCTPDVSKKEQMSFVVRYVENKNGVVKPVEHFLGFQNPKKSTGEALCDLAMKTLQDLGIDSRDLRGQGYDNGPNMKGRKKRLSSACFAETPPSRICTISPKGIVRQ